MPRPCVIYLHCNSGSRVEGLGYAEYILNYGMHYFSFDFSGSGVSDGEFISLGVKETEDLETVVRYIREKLYIDQIVLWGRSMGAVTALRYVENDRKINGIIADSPFSSLYKLALELGEEKTAIPGILLPPMLKIVEQTIKEKAGFDFKALEMTNFGRNSLVPCIFITSKEDNFVRSQHVESLYDNYGGNKKILYVVGDHNNERDHNFLNDIVKRILEMLLPKREMPKINLVESKNHYKLIFDQENTPALPLTKDRENRKIFNLQNILDTNKEIAKKNVISKKKETVTRLDTEVLYDEIPEISLQNHNKTSHTSAFRLKDKMQTFIHNTTVNSYSNTGSIYYGLNNATYGNSKMLSSYEAIGSVKHGNDSKRVLNEFQQKSFNRINITNTPYKREYNKSFHSKNNEVDWTRNENIDFVKDPLIKINNLCYSNPVDLKQENYTKQGNNIPYNHEEKQKNQKKEDDNQSLTMKNRRFL